MLERDPKRRRLTSVNAPFRSPLHRTSTADAISTPTSKSSSAPTSSASTPTPVTPNRPSRPRNFRSPLHKASEEGLSGDIKELLHRKRVLQESIRNERSALEIAEQALKYQEQGQDEALEKLVVKWRRCAQKTAERVFVNARNRIDRLGGFKEFMKSQRQSSWKEEDSQGNGRDQEEYGDKKEEEGEEEEEEEFTMEVMLRMAGVNERLVGWDRDLNNFVKE